MGNFQVPNCRDYNQEDFSEREPVGNSFPISASLCSIPAVQILPQVYGNSTPTIIYCVALPGAGYSWAPTSYLSSYSFLSLWPQAQDVRGVPCGSL